jgi:hypothetical protein
MTIKADIRFGNGQVIRCIGRVGHNGETIPFKDAADVEAHCAHVRERSQVAEYAVVNIIEGGAS